MRAIVQWLTESDFRKCGHREASFLPRFYFENFKAEILKELKEQSTSIKTHVDFQTSDLHHAWFSFAEPFKIKL